MERDYEFPRACILPISTRRKRSAARPANAPCARLGARKAATGPVDVVFDPRVARGIAGHLAGAINGASVARKTSFLRDMMGKQVAAAAITVTDEPLQRARPGVAPVRRRRRRGREAGRWSRTAC